MRLLKKNKSSFSVLRLARAQREQLTARKGNGGNMETKLEAFRAVLARIKADA